MIKMGSRCMSVLLLVGYVLVDCASAAVHGHAVDSGERELDGSYRPRDADHYGDEGHNVEFDHEAILGSVKDAEEFDKLSPEEARRRLAELVGQMDLNQDKFIDRTELKKWIQKSFINLSKEEAEERFKETDGNKDGAVTWTEYLEETFGVDNEEDIALDDLGDTGMMVAEEKVMWNTADTDGDGILNLKEFEVFTNPEEHEVMHGYIRNQTLKEKDKNRDGKIDFDEYIGDRAGMQKDREWLISEQEKFNHELDKDQNGYLDLEELHRWVIPDNEELAEEEMAHLFASADDDHDDLLSYQEILDHHDVFVGSEATDYGNNLIGDHFDDEL